MSVYAIIYLDAIIYVVVDTFLEVGNLNKAGIEVNEISSYIDPSRKATSKYDHFVVALCPKTALEDSRDYFLQPLLFSSLEAGRSLGRSAEKDWCSVA